MKKKWTGERLETFIFTRDTIDHLHRYAITSKYTKDKVVLDIASGEGYGSNLISKNAKYVYGVDIDTNTIALAKTKYHGDNLEFIVGSTNLIPLQNNSVDVVVSYETIEHHDEHEQMMIEIKRVLKPDGVLLISTPDKYYYSDIRNFNNKFHVKELYKNEFSNLISDYFKKVQLLNQTFVNGNSLINQDDETLKMELFTGDFSKINEVDKDLTYLIIIASDNEFHKQQLSVFEGDLLNKQIEKSISRHYQKSSTYKVGKFILTPLLLIKKLFV